MAEALTPQQQIAVSNRGGKLLVSAAAGSGKTKVLVDRLLSYLTDSVQPVNIDDFLIITYTKAAAAELRGKIAAKLTEAVAADPSNRHLQRQLQRLYLTKISTVHSFCSDILREYAYMLDISGDFRVADESECVDLQKRTITQVLDELYTSINENHAFRAFVEMESVGRDDRQVPELILNIYNKSRCHLNPTEWLDACSSVMNVDVVSDVSETKWGKYIISELHEYLTDQYDALQTCIQLGTEAGDMEKVVQLLIDTQNQIKAVLNCFTWDEIQSKIDIDFGRLVFPRKLSNTDLAEQIKAVRSACKKGIERRARRFSNTNQQIISDIKSVALATYGLVSSVKLFSLKYERIKRSQRVLDFGDLEHKMLDLLLGKHRSGPTAVAAEIGNRFCEIMVDEYQDSNEVQDTIFSTLTQKRHNCFMVGDVKQSIYQFRLADPSIFLEKYNSFLPAEVAIERQERKVLLSSNFRSCGAVISAVNDVFSACMSASVGGLDYGESEALYEGIPHVEIGEPEIEFYGITVRQDTYAEEAAFTAKRISELLDGTHMIREGSEMRSIRAEDIVILLRSPGSVGFDFCAALEQHGIPVSMGGNSDLLQSEEVIILLSLLRVINNPRQDIPLLTVLASRVFGFTANDLADFRKENRHSDIYTALIESKNSKAIKFVESLTKIRSEARMLKVTEIIGYIFNLTRMDSMFASLPDGDVRTANLQEFCRIASNYETCGIVDLPSFLERIEFASERGISTHEEDRTSGAVTVMSIHKSKGLEFPVVFLCGLSREFNREDLKAPVLCDKELGIGASCCDRVNRVRYPSIGKTAISIKILRESISEEMRVLYVAMTRAKDRLIMTYAARNFEGELIDIAKRMDICRKKLITTEVDCPGKWILYAALQRNESNELFSICGKPDKCRVTDRPWLVRVVDAPECVGGMIESREMIHNIPEDVVEKIRNGLNYHYGYIAATKAPSKQTATQLKGREKDNEAANQAAETQQVVRFWRKPTFINSPVNKRMYGTALHAAMQYINYEVCVSVEGIKGEIDRLVKQQYIPEEYGRIIDCSKIDTFFRTEIGSKVRTSANVLREFKFSILDDGARYGDSLQSEKVLLQGVVDCAVIEADGITVLDFKTDYVTEDTIMHVAEKYKPQIEAYANALAKIYEARIKARQIYFFAVDRFVEV